MIVHNAKSFNRSLDQAVDRFEKKFRARVEYLMREGMKRLIRRTPVWTGQAVRNYVATGGAPYGGPVKQAPDPVEPTNRLPLGAEQLRASARNEAMNTLNMVDFSNPYQKFYITNRTPHIAGLEAGVLPRSPLQQRSPGGMFAVTVQELSTLLESGVTP